MSDLTEAMLPYRHAKYLGVFNLEPNRPDETFTCDNHHLFTAHYHNLCYQRGEEIVPADKIAYQVFLDGCDLNQPGLYRRFPGREGNQISHDELIGICYLSKRFGFDAAKKIGAWLRPHDGFYDTTGIYREEPDESAFLYRMPELSIAIPFASSEFVGMPDEMIWAVSALLSVSTPKENTSGKLLEYLQASMYRGLNPVIDSAIDVWSYFMSKKYPGGARELFSIYFGLRHPFGLYAPTHFDLRKKT